MSSDFDSNAEPPPSPLSPPAPVPLAGLPPARPVRAPTEVPRRRMSPLAVLGLSYVALGGLIVMIVGGRLVWTKQEGNQRPVDLAEEREIEREEVATTFLAPTPPTHEESRSLALLFDGLGIAIANNNERVVTKATDADRLTRELALAGRLDNLGLPSNPEKRSAVRTDVVQGFGSVLIANPALRWDSTEIRQVRWSADRSEAAVIAVHRSGWGGETGIVTLKMRWWLVSRNGVWRLYDLEDLDVGYRLTRVIEAITTPELVQNHVRKECIAKVREAMQASKNRDFKGCKRALSMIPAGPLPKPLQATVEVMKAWLLLLQRKGAQALEKCDLADGLNPDMPSVHSIRARAYLQLERHEECVASARKYLALLSSDPDTNLVEGAALEALGRVDEAQTAYRAVLGEAPDSIDALDGLRRLLPAANQGEIVDRLVKARDPKRTLQLVIERARDEGDQAGVTVLVEALRRRFPKDRFVLEEDVRACVEVGQFEKAQALVKQGLALLLPEDRRAVRDVYLRAMAGRGLFLAAYAAMPGGEADESFRFLADEFTQGGFQLSLVGLTDAATEQLRALIAAHRKCRPDDAWLEFFDALLMMKTKDYVGAEASLEAGAKRLADGVPAEDRERFRRQRIDCLYRLGKGLEAYETISPVEETFHQLAYCFLDDGKLDDLNTLIVTFDKRHPNDVLGMYWRGQWHFAKGEYPAAAAAYHRFRDNAKSPRDDGQLWDVNNQLVRSLLRTGQLTEAQNVVQNPGGIGPSFDLRAAVAAARNDVAEVDRLMGEQKANKRSYDYFYADEDFVRETAGPMFDSIRAKYPPPKKQPAKPDT